MIRFRLPSPLMITCINRREHPSARSSECGDCRLWARALFTSVLAALLLVGAAPSFAQDLGAFARAERARKEAQPTPPGHVYTKDDLANPKILTPEDQKRFDAARKKEPVPLQNNPETTVAADSDPNEAPLGDIARQYRQQKQSREAQQGAKFPLTITSAPALASPAPAQPVATKTTVETLAPASLSKPSAASPKSLKGSQGPAHGLPLATILPQPKDSTKSAVASPLVRPSNPANRQTLVVRRGDSLWRLAARYLGNGARWRELMGENPLIADPNRLAVGQQITVPVEAAVAEPLHGLRIEPGDTLWGIARAQFGSGSSWTCLAQANPQISDPNRIYAGQSLALPSGCGTP